MKNGIILVILLCICGCASTKHSQSFVIYKVSETNKLVKIKYQKITLEQANGLIASFATDGIAKHRNIIIAASKNKEIKISLYSSCKEHCQYIVDAYFPCYGDTQYYFKLTPSSEKPKFTFAKEQEGMTECCLVPRKSWFRRILWI